MITVLTPQTVKLLNDSPLVPFILAAVLALHGLRRRSLSPSGAITAFLVGFSMLALPLRTFGISLLVFYFIGSRATKIGAVRKATLEEGHHVSGGGYRGAVQVLCNSFGALRASLVWAALFVPASVPGQLASRDWIRQNRGRPFVSSIWCPLTPSVAGGWSRRLLLVTLGHFACCLGDTLASELGILSPSPPRLITTFKPVPPGTNGAVSIYGTLASLAGGAIMGLVMSVSLILESTRCREESSRWAVELIAWGAIAGVLGSLIDSLLGATLQRTRYSETTKRILLDDAPVPAPSPQTDSPTNTPEKQPELKIISGLNILSNNQVNFISSILTGWIISRLA